MIDPYRYPAEINFSHSQLPNVIPDNTLGAGADRGLLDNARAYGMRTSRRLWQDALQPSRYTAAMRCDAHAPVQAALCPSIAVRAVNLDCHHSSATLAKVLP